MSPFDPSGVVEVARAISIRDLVRSPGSFVAEVEKEGAIIALARNGRMVALLTPLPERFVVEFDGPPIKEMPRIEVVEAEDVALPDSLNDLRDVAESILLHALEYHPMPFPNPHGPHPHKKVMVTMAYLEIEGFTERRWAGEFLTPKGLAAARAMQRLLDTDRRPAPS